MTTTMTHKFRRLVAFAAVLALLSVSAPARATDPLVAAVVLENRSGVELKVSNLKYTDGDGKEITLEGSWKLQPKSNGYLINDGKKIYASKIVFDLTTDDGTTKGWLVSAKQLDKDGDFASNFSADNLASHRKLLGKPQGALKPVVALKPAGPDPIALANAEAEVTRLEGQLRKASGDILGAELAEALAVAAYNNTDPGSGARFLASVAVAATRQELSRAVSTHRSAESALQAATTRLNAIKYSSDR